MTLARIAVALAFNRDPEHRWRRWTVATTASLFTFLALGATSAVLLNERITQRHEDRRPVLSAEPKAEDLFFEEDLDYWRGRRIHVAWIRPAESTDKSVLPPGIRDLPPPGTTVVSPELARLAERHSELGLRYPQRKVLTSSGVGSAGELVAYVRPPAGRRIGGEEHALHIENGEWHGRGPLARIGGFGPDGLPVLGGEPVAWWEVPAGALALGVVPGLILLGAGLATSSRLRDHRLQVLHGVGVPRRKLLLVGCLESVILVLPGAILATAAWAALTPLATRVPFTALEVQRGDLWVPGWLLMTVLTATVASAAVTSVGVTAAITRNRVARPVSSRTQPSWRAAIPLAVGSAGFLAAGVLPYQYQSPAMAIGVVGAMSGAPLMLPFVLSHVGSRLSESPRLTVSWVGRRMAFDPRRSARPFLGITTVVVLTLTVAFQFSSRDLLQQEVSPPGTSALEGVTVRWRDVVPGDLARFTGALREGVVVPYRTSGAAGQSHEHPLSSDADEPGSAHHHGSGLALQVGVRCSELSALIDVDCAAGRPFALGDADSTAVQTLIARVIKEPVTSVELIGSSDVTSWGAAVVLGRTPLEQLDQDVRRAARTTLPAAYVDSDVFERNPAPSPIQQWLPAGLGLAITLLGLAVFIMTIDRVVAGRRQVRHLVNLGMPLGPLCRLSAVQFASSYLVAVAIGVTVGYLVWMQFATIAADGFMHGPTAWWLGLALASVGLVGTCVTVATEARAAQREAT